ncbi:hypothetical protein M3J09_013483 [Ascochyta lentis]
MQCDVQHRTRPRAERKKPRTALCSPCRAVPNRKIHQAPTRALPPSLPHKASQQVTKIEKTQPRNIPVPAYYVNPVPKPKYPNQLLPSMQPSPQPTTPTFPLFVPIRAQEREEVKNPTCWLDGYCTNQVVSLRST